jgi:Pyridoxal-phosphate dependent enzyme
MTGSIKDRMALHILKKAYAPGRIRPGDTIADSTSGNTGIAFSAIGRALGHPVRIFMPVRMSRERQDLIRSYGAEIVLVSAAQGGFLESIRLSEEFARSRSDVFLPPVFEQRQPRSTRGNPRLGDLCPTGVSGASPRQFCCGSWNRRNGDGSGTLQASASMCLPAKQYPWPIRSR